MFNTPKYMEGACKKIEEKMDKIQSIAIFELIMLTELSEISH